VTTDDWEYWGVDYGIRRIAMGCPQLGLAPDFVVAKSDPLTEINQLAGWVQNILNYSPDKKIYLMVESPIAGQSGNMQTAVRMAMTAGGILSGHPYGGLIAPSSWKKLIVGSGRADKSAVRDWLQANHPSLAEICYGVQDRVDALCIGLAARVIHEAQLG
jgi:Holliday junction resolvasome RuvABC endonuclease subunit